MPVSVMNSRNSAQMERTAPVQCLQSNIILPIKQLMLHFYNFLFVIENSKLTRLPRRNDSIVRTTDQHEVLQAEETLSKCWTEGSICGTLVVHYCKEIRPVEKQLLAMRVIPVICNGPTLTQLCVK